MRWKQGTGGTGMTHLNLTGTEADVTTDVLADLCSGKPRLMNAMTIRDSNFMEERAVRTCARRSWSTADW